MEVYLPGFILCDFPYPHGRLLVTEDSLCSCAAVISDSVVLDRVLVDPYTDHQDGTVYGYNVAHLEMASTVGDHHNAIATLTTTSSNWRCSKYYGLFYTSLQSFAQWCWCWTR